jgi:transmembrane sensor
MSSASQPRRDAAADATNAAAWLARRDRGLTPAEQDAFLQWLREDARHRAELGRLDRTWEALDVLAEWRPAHSARPNPDLLARGRRRSRRVWWYAAGTLAAAASLVLGVILVRPKLVPVTAPVVGLQVLPAPERVVLEDGSVVEANQGWVFSVAFTPAERRVRLLDGEVHFTVAKNPARPFVVDVAGVTVRAVGTAFNVRRSTSIVDVLVTEGRVQVEPAAPRELSPAIAPAPTPVAAGQQATIDAAQPLAAPVVVALNPAQIQHALAWQGVRLIFDELPLSAVVAEFNLRNRRQLVIADPRVAGLRVTGSFRADNVEAFTRLLEASFGVAVEQRADGTLALRRQG